MQKDILFYSNLCEYCKEILATLVKNNLRDYFMLVNIDNRSYKLPPFVDRVPLIYTTQRKVFADENLLNYIQSKIVSSTLQPYALVGTNTNAYSENFSFIEDSDNVIEDSSRNYNLVGSEHQKIYAPTEDDSNNKGTPQILEKFMAERDSDIEKIFGNTPNRF